MSTLLSSRPRRAAWLGLLACVPALVGCGVAETAPPAVRLEPAVFVPPADTLAPDVREPLLEPPPKREPAVSLQERWAAPFAVHSSGRPASRDERRVVVAGGARPQPVAAKDSASAAPADRRAAAPGRDSAVTAPRTAPPPPSSPAASRPAPAAATGTRTHRVEWGETWYGIARQYGVSVQELSAANPDVAPERLRSGQVVRIPRSAAGQTARRTHVVGAGDTLWGIAHRYGVSAAAIRKANQLRDDLVRLGQTLIIPQEETR